MKDKTIIFPNYIYLIYTSQQQEIIKFRSSIWYSRLCKKL